MPTSDVEDDLQWLELLAGRAAPDALPHTRTEAAWLRAAMLTYKAQPPAGVPPDPAQRIDELMRRAIAAGLFTEQDLSAALAPRAGDPGKTEAVVPQGGLVARLAAWFDGLLGTANQPMRWVAVAASAMAVTWVLWSVQAPDRGADDALRGGAPVQEISAASVADEQRLVLAQLKQAGFEATPFERLGRRGIEVQMPEKPTVGQLDALKALRLRVPDGPQLVIEFVPRPAP